MPSPNERLSAANVIDNVVFNGVKVDNSTSAKLAHRILRDLASAGYEVMPVPSREDLLTAEEASAYTFFPNGPEDFHEEIRVERTNWGFGPYPDAPQWAVRRRSYCLDVDGEWVRERQPSNRDEDFLDRHRFSLDDALDIARRLASQEGTP